MNELTPYSLELLQWRVVVSGTLALLGRVLLAARPGWLSRFVNYTWEWLFWVVCVEALGYAALVWRDPEWAGGFRDFLSAALFGILVTAALARGIGGFVSERVAAVDELDWFAPLLARFKRRPASASHPPQPNAQ